MDRVGPSDRRGSPLDKLLPSRAASACLLAALSTFSLLEGTPALALVEGGAGGQRIRSSHFAEDTCKVIEEEALRHNLPAPFLARLVWRESLFNPLAVSPKGARGIAQFMPETAAERGLADPFDPGEALAASAHFLADLKAQFGSLGLAAAAYNAGPERVQGWRGGSTGLPLETQEYVHWITGHRAEDWLKKDKLQPLPISEKLPFMPACTKLAAGALMAKAPAGALTTASVQRMLEARFGFKRIKASQPGRIRVVFDVGPRSSNKARTLKRKRR